MRRLHETEPIPPLTDFGVSPEVEAVIRKATAKRLEDRYSTAEEMLAALTGGEATASLLLFTSPGSADVFVDNIPRGASDQERGRLLVEGLTPGLHSVRVTKTGYDFYKIDMMLEASRRTDLQVQLPARSTVAIPRFDEAGQPDASTNRIASGDEVRTAMLVFESLPAGSTVAFGQGQRVLAGEDGRATVPLGPGTHQFEVTDPSGDRKQDTVTITDEEIGSYKTVAMAPGPRRTGAAFGTAQAGSAQPRAIPAAPPVAATGAQSSPSRGKKIAAGLSVIIFAALSAAAIIVIRGPGKAPQQQVASEASANAIGPVPTPTLAPTQQPTVNAVVPSPTPTPAPSVNKKDETNKQNPLPTPTAKPIEETPKPERNPHDNSPVSVPPPPVQPTPQIIKPTDEPDTETGTCLTVIVTGPGGGPVAGVRVAVTDEPSLYQGMTGPNGRWRRCGLTPGHRVMVRVFKAGNVVGTRQDILTAGRNFIGVQVQQPADPYSESSRPGRKPGLWQRQP
jgi:hypothetical protein